LTPNQLHTVHSTSRSRALVSQILEIYENHFQYVFTYAMKGWAGSGINAWLDISKLPYAYFMRIMRIFFNTHEIRTGILKLLHCVFHAYFMRISCVFHAYFMRISCVCHAYFMRISCIFHAYFMRISCVCHAFSMRFHAYFMRISCVFCAFSCVFYAFFMRFLCVFYAFLCVFYVF
jgi:hypothetical protein